MISHNKIYYSSSTCSFKHSYGTTNGVMSRIPLPLEDCDRADAWLRSLAALSRTKGLTDNEDNRSVTDLFLANAGMEAVR